MARSEQYRQGELAALKWCITWLHKRADEMNDTHAKIVLNSAAFSLGCEKRDGTALASRQDAREAERKVQNQIDALCEWLNVNAPTAAEEQKHLDEGSTERAYWHYGRMVGLLDALRCLEQQGRSTEGQSS